MKAMLKRLFFGALSLWLRARMRVLAVLYPSTHAGVEVGKGSFIHKGCLELGEGCRVRIGCNVQIQSRLSVGPGCTLELGDDCCVEDHHWTLRDKGWLKVGARTRLGGDSRHPCFSIVDSGNVTIGDGCFLQASFFTRFGSSIRLGSHVGSSHGTELVADESISLGDHVMLSYDISIYDTNSHSTDHLARRVSLEGHGAEHAKPVTKPVRIGSDCWLGKGVMVLKGASLGERCIVGMGTVVPAGEYPAGSRILGSKPKVLA